MSKTMHPALFVGIGPRECCYCFAESKGAYHAYGCSTQCSSVLVHHVLWCRECEDDECEVEAHLPANLPTFCNACNAPADHFAGDCLGNVHDECESHRSYLSGYVRDVENEVRCDGIAAARFEDAAYGRD
jgi:hypothetical protein